MIKICFVTTISLTLKSFVLEVAKHLFKTGDFDITMICSPDKNFEKELPPYIKFIPVKMKRGISFDGPRVVKELKKVFKEKKYDIVQYSTPNASYYASIAAKKADIPVRLYCQWGIAYVGFRGLKRKLLKIVEKHICNNSTWVEPDSKSNLDFAHKERLYSDNIGSVIWNGSACGVNLTKFDISKRYEYRNEIRKKYSIPDHSFVFGFVGRITRDKGINELLEAFKRLEDGSYLLLVGPKEIDDTIDKELYEWSLKQDSIIFVGYTNQVEKYLSAMDCFVLPSYREGFGMGVIEAEAMGVPTIVTNIPGPVDAVVENETSLLVDVKDSNSLFLAMLKFLQNREMAIEYGKNAAEFSRTNFDQKKMFCEIEKDRKRLFFSKNK